MRLSIMAMLFVSLFVTFAGPHSLGAVISTSARAGVPQSSPSQTAPGPPSPLGPVAHPVFYGPARPLLGELPGSSHVQTITPGVVDPVGLAAAKRNPQARVGGSNVPDPAQTTQSNQIHTLATNSTAATVGVAFDAGDIVSGAAGGFSSPPDVDVAVGPNHVVETVNLRMYVYSKSGGLASSFSLVTFFSALDSGYNIMSDPRLLYDVPSGRWFLALIGLNTSTNTGAIWIAVSTSSDPTSTWNEWRYSSSGSLPDFPGLGISDDKLAIATNAFLAAGGTVGGFLGAQFLIVRKTDLTAGATSPNATASTTFANAFSIQPAQSMSSTTALFMTSQDTTNSGSLWSVTGEPGVTTVSYVRTTLNMVATIPPLASQQGSSALLDTGDNRLQRAVWRSGKLWASGNSACSWNGDIATRSCLRLVQIDTSSPSLITDELFGAAGTYYFYPAVQTDSAGNLFVVFGRSSPTIYPELRLTVQLTTDSSPEASIQLKAGNNAYVCSFCGSPSRYGDFFGAAVEPSNMLNVWVAGEYAKAAATPSCLGCSAGDDWGTYIAQVTTPSGSPSVSSSPSSVAPGGTVTITWSGIASPTPGDWLTIAPAGSGPSTYIAWRYTTGAASGSVTMTVPANAPVGSYEIHLLANNTYTLLATSSPFNIGSAALAHPTPPTDGSTYFGLTLRTWDSASPGWGDTRSYPARVQDAVNVDLGGKTAAFVTAYAGWQDANCTLIPFTSGPLQTIQATDAAFGRPVVPMLEWFAEGGDATAADYHCVTTRDIAAGTYDAYVHQYARDVKEWGRPVFIRNICGEMNGSWWKSCSPMANTALTAADFVNAWRRVVDIFRSEGASNVAWIWTPNPIHSWTDQGLDQYWPGDGYVDWAGGDVYDVDLASDLDPLYSFALTHAKPFFIGEFGIRHAGAAQATSAFWSAWLTSIFDYVESHSQVKAVNYFNYKLNYEADTSGNVFLYGGQVNYHPGSNDYDHRLLAGGTDVRSLFTTRISNSRYTTSVSTVTGP